MFNNNWRVREWSTIYCPFCGLYYKHSVIVNDDSSIVHKFEASLTDDARVVIYNHPMFIVQATNFILH
jgi:hypothetical protein